MYKLYIEFYSKNSKGEKIYECIEIEYPKKKGFILIHNRIKDVLNE